MIQTLNSGKAEVTKKRSCLDASAPVLEVDDGTDGMTYIPRTLWAAVRA